jgi:ferredoxin-thioredoxin reductase catalytic subunit
MSINFTIVECPCGAKMDEDDVINNDGYCLWCESYLYDDEEDHWE